MARLEGGRLVVGRSAYDYFVDKGLKPPVAAAFAGNLAWESGGSPGTITTNDNVKNSPSSPHSIGIGQWNDRAPALLRYAREQGIEVPKGDLKSAAYAQQAIQAIPLEVQLGFMWKEMGSSERRSLMSASRAEDVRGAAAGAIGYHRPAGFTWKNPEGGHGFDNRVALGEQILADAGTRPALSSLPDRGTPGPYAGRPDSLVVHNGMGGEAGGGVVARSSFPVGGSRMEDRNPWATTPTDGGRPGSRDFLGPRAGGRHAGLDIPGRPGDAITAPLEGRVVRAGSAQGYGNMVDVRYSDGSVHRVAHLESIADGVKTGSSVTPGMTLGKLGSTGNATPDFPHGHYEVFPDGKSYAAAASGSSRATADARMSPREWYSRTFGVDTSYRGGDPIPGGSPSAAPSMLAGDPRKTGSFTTAEAPPPATAELPPRLSAAMASIDEPLRDRPGSSLGTPPAPMTDRPGSSLSGFPSTAPETGGNAGSPAPGGAGMREAWAAAAPGARVSMPPPMPGGQTPPMLPPPSMVYGDVSPTKAADMTITPSAARMAESGSGSIAPSGPGGDRYTGPPMSGSGSISAGAALVEPIAPSGPGDTGPDGEPAPPPPLAAPSPGSGASPGSEPPTPSGPGGVSAPATPSGVAASSGAPGGRAVTGGTPPIGATDATPGAPGMGASMEGQGGYPDWARDAFQMGIEGTRHSPDQGGGGMGTGVDGSPGIGGDQFKFGKGSLGQLFGFGSGPVQIPTMRSFFGGFFGG